jgi:hypothetical protein
MTFLILSSGVVMGWILAGLLQETFGGDTDREG